MYNNIILTRGQKAIYGYVNQKKLREVIHQNFARYTHFYSRDLYVNILSIRLLTHSM